MFARKKQGSFVPKQGSFVPKRRPGNENAYPHTATVQIPSRKPSEATMAKLQNFAYKRPLDPPAPPTVAPSPAHSSQGRIMDEGMHPATPVPRRVPLSDLISNTPIRGEVAQEVSPDDKVVWKLSPKKILEAPSASQESPPQQETIFLNLMEHPVVVATSNGAARPTVNRIKQEHPSTPLIRKTRPLPGPSPLSLKRSASFGNQNPSSDRAKRRRTRSSDLVLQRRVSSLLEQAQSFVRPDDSQNPRSDDSTDDSTVNISSDEFPCDVDLEALAQKFDMVPLSSDGAQMDVDEPGNSDDKEHSDEIPAVDVGERSDDLFDTTFDDLDVEELASLDMSSNETMPTAPPTAAVDEDEIFFEDGFDELMDLEMESPQTEESMKPVCKRFKVISIENTTFLQDSKPHIQKTLHLEIPKSDETCIAHLRGDWVTSVVEVNDLVNVIGHFPNDTCIIDNTTGFLILHPDNLVSSTHVADSFKCLRRAVLQDQIKATTETSKPLIYGSIIHELFQQALLKMDFSTPHLETVLAELVVRYIEKLYCIGLPPEDATMELREKVPLLQMWAQLFVAPNPSMFSFMADHCGSTDAKPKVCINKVLDIEEHIWSPTYGLKGNIDATVQVRVEEEQEEGKTWLVPLEVKTGKNTSLMNHRAQTMLYTLMMSDRYDVDVKCGILYYVDARESIRVRALRNEIRGLIMGRNELARWIKARVGLPEMLKSPRDCKNCYAADSCLVYHKTLEAGTAESSGLGSWFDEQTGHLHEIDATFLKHWTSLLDKEEADIFRFRNELWTMLSPDREKLGRCFGNLVIIPEATSIDKDSDKINRFRYRFRRNDVPAVGIQSRASFLNSQMNIGDPIVVSDESGHFALANGFITALQPDLLSVNVDRRLHGARTRLPGFDARDNQVFSGIAEILDSGETRISSQRGSQVGADLTYRVDKDEFKSGMAMARNNIVQLFTKEGDVKRRELIVRGREPVFRASSERTQYSYFQSARETLNVDQRRAVEKVLTAEDYALVLGMPGTGKTTTIAHIIRALVENGKSVLLTSYTHTAVDNILLKLKNDGIKMLRLGSMAKIHPEVREFAVGGNIKAQTFAELHEIYTSPLVVATTCLGINHFIFNKRKFDYCIVDEASQITLPACLGPLRYADRFVLVGDHYQLPPLVRNQEALAGGLDVSLFRKLSEEHPAAMTVLEHQYRMNEDIMLLSNVLVYDGMLKCGNEAVAKRSLRIPDATALAFAKPWVRDVLSERYKLVFCDTDLVPALETKRGDRTTNELEVTFIKQIVDSLRKGGIPSSAIGIMSIYRSQVKLLSHILSPDHPDVEIHTADRFQGRDKEVVIISLVRSNPDHYVGDLLQDWRRVNVAFTRAKSKLVIFGSRSTIRDTKPLDEFVKLVEARGWVYSIPHEAGLEASRGSVGRSPRKSAKENVVPMGPGKKVARVSGETVLKGRAVLRDIVNEHR